MKKNSIYSKKPYNAFYRKRLQTQSYLQTEMSSTNMSDLTSKIIKSIKASNIQGQKIKQKVIKAKNKKHVIDTEESEQRSKLRSKIQDRMRMSKTNLQKLNSEKKKALSSRSQFQQSQRNKIKEQQKKQLEQSLVRVTKYQGETQKFFRDSKMRRQSQFDRLQKIPDNQAQTSYYRERSLISSASNSVQSKYSRTKSNLNIKKRQDSVLKVSDSEIKQKQMKKQAVQKVKESKYLNQYISKMEEIMNIRRKHNKSTNQPIKPTLPKVVSIQRKPMERYGRRQKGVSVLGSQRNSFYSNQGSFSQKYSKKLAEKLNKKQYYHSEILERGNEILQKERMRTKIIKEDKIIRDTLNDYKRWSNFINRT